MIIDHNWSINKVLAYAYKSCLYKIRNNYTYYSNLYKLSVSFDNYYVMHGLIIIIVPFKYQTEQ